MTDHNDELTGWGTAETAARLDNHDVTSTELVEAYLRRIDDHNPTLNAFTQIFHRRAREAAAAADARRRAKNTRSPFDGVPITLKENMAIAGDEVTLGIPQNKGKRATRDSAIYTMVDRAGAVVLGKTNVSQGMLYFESRNPLYGESKNPYNHERTPGGSSGGEAAAIAAKLSPGGFGTDIGGSIRIPAHFCGICGIKPSPHRVPLAFTQSGVPGQELIKSGAGPMARSVDDLQALFTLTAPEKVGLLDPRVPPLPIGNPNDIDVRGLRVGYFDTDHIVEPSAALKRAVEESVGYLKDAGCEVVPYAPRATDEIAFAFFSALSSDGGRTLRGRLEGGEIDDALTLLITLLKLPRPVRKAAGVALQAAGDRVAGRVLEAIGERSVADWWALSAKVRQLTIDVMADWAHHNIDAVVCPPFSTPAIPHGASRDFSIGGALSMRYNLLHLPAGVVPVTSVRTDETTRSSVSGTPEKRAASIDAQSTGLPVGVQIVARPYREDVVMALMAVVQDAARGQDGYPALL